MAAEKWLMFVVDGSADMGPHWPTIFSQYVEKILRYSCSKWREPETNCTKVEFGLIMYNVDSHDHIDCHIQCSHWTSNADQFLQMLSELTFNGNGIKYRSSMTDGLAEALVMFPKPPIGMPSKEYFDGERHCVLVGATHPTSMCSAVHVPKIGVGKLFGSHTDYCVANYREVAELYAPLAVSLSVISTNQVPAWRELFKLGNNISPIADEDPLVCNNTANDQFNILISENFREAHDALSPQEGTSSSQQNAELEQTAIIISCQNFPCQFSDFNLLWGIMSKSPNSQQNNYAETIPAEADKVMDKNQQLVEQEKTGIITLSSDSEIREGQSKDSEISINISEDPSLLRGIMDEPTTRKQNTPATQVSAEAATAEHATFSESLPVVPQNKDAIQSHVAPSLFLSQHSTDEIIAKLNARGDIALPQFTSENCASFLNQYHSQSQSSHLTSDLTDKIGDSLGQELNSQEALLPTQAGCGLESLVGTSQNLPRSQSSLSASTANASEEVNSSRKAVQEFRANQISVLKPNYSSCNCAATAFLSRENCLSLQPENVEVATSQGINTRKAQNPAGAALGSKANLSIQRSSSCRQKSSGKSSKTDRRQRGSISRPSVQPNLSGNKRGLTSVFGPMPGPEVGSSTLVPATEIPQITHARMDQLPPLIPMENQLNYVKTWEGAISATNQGNLIFLTKAKAFRNITACPTLAASWPQWLQVSGVIAQSAVDITSGSVDYLVFEMLTNNDSRLFEILSTNVLSARFDLPFQTLILTPTREPSRFIGTLLQGEFPVKPPPLRYSSLEHPKQPHDHEGAATGATGFASGSN